MPRPKPAKASPHFKARGHALSDDAKAVLTKLLGAPSGSQRALREVEKWLGFFIAGQPLIDRIHFDHIQLAGAPASAALMETIRRLRRVFRNHYRGPRTERRWRGAAQSLRSEEARELRFVKTALRSINTSSYRGLQQLRSKRSLLRLFLDSRCRPPPGPKERMDAIERMAKKVRRARNREQPTLALTEKIEQGKLADGFTARDIRRNDWPHLRTSAQVQSALDRMMREGRLQAVPRRAGGKGGRPTLEYSTADRTPTKPPADT